MTNNLSTTFRVSQRNSFTLIELLVVLALVAILSVVVILTLNPAELIKQARDSNRLSDLATINTALNLFSADVTSGFMGTSTMVYVSIPDTSPTCANLGLPTLPTSTIIYTYNCVTSANLRNTDGTGWVPVNFQRISSNSPISQLPIDPVNTTSTGNYYTYVSGGSWILTAIPESTKQKTELSVRPQVTNYPGVIGMGNNLNLSPLFNSTGLVGYWKFDEGSGATAKDSSGNGNDGTLNGGPTWSGGKIGGGMTFDNSLYQHVATINTAILQPTTAVSLALWIKTDITSGPYITVAADTNGNSLTHGYGMHLTSNRLYFFAADNDYWSLFTPYTDTSSWHHVVGTYNGSVENIYVDGIPSASLSATGPMVYTGAIYGFTIAAAQYGITPYYYKGSLDDVRVYNRALSAAEVLALYNSTK